MCHGVVRSRFAFAMQKAGRKHSENAAPGRNGRISSLPTFSKSSRGRHLAPGSSPGSEHQFAGTSDRDLD